MMTAPSTMMPKSSAPRLMRFAADPCSRPCPSWSCSIESGMTSAVMSAARKLPRNRKRMTMTRSAPSTRFFSTVAMVASTSVGAVVDGPRDDAFGERAGWISSQRSRRRACETARLFSPISMNDRPEHDLLAVLAWPRPSAVRRPATTSATSRTRTGTPLVRCRGRRRRDLVQPADLARACGRAAARRAARRSPRRRSGCCASSAVDHVAEREAVGEEPVGVGLDVELLLVAADRVDLGHAGHVAELGPDDPVLDGPQVGRRVGQPVGRRARRARPRRCTCRSRPGRSRPAPWPDSRPGGRLAWTCWSARRVAVSRSRCRCPPRRRPSPGSARSARRERVYSRSGSPATAVSTGNVIRCSTSSGE